MVITVGQTFCYHKTGRQCPGTWTCRETRWEICRKEWKPFNSWLLLFSCFFSSLFLGFVCFGGVVAQLCVPTKQPSAWAPPPGSSVYFLWGQVLLLQEVLPLPWPFPIGEMCPWAHICSQLCGASSGYLDTNSSVFPNGMRLEGIASAHYRWNE